MIGESLIGSYDQQSLIRVVRILRSFVNQFITYPIRTSFSIMKTMG
jgi:hypothetical protein